MFLQNRSLFTMTLFLLILINLMSAHPAPVEQKVCLTEDENTLWVMVNNYRQKKYLPAIPISRDLTIVAHTHVRDLHSYFNIQTSKECNPHSWSTHGNWEGCCYGSDHSNKECMWDKPGQITDYHSRGYEIAFYQSDGAIAFTALEAWKKSKGHNEVILNKDTWSKISWQAMGVGIFEEYAVIWFGELKDKNSASLCP